MIDPRSPNFDSTPIAADRGRFAYAPADIAHAATPSVSVVTPFFNTSEVFHETAACLLGHDARGRNACSGQSLQSFEWIIVNDCSTDPASLAILESYRRLARTDPRIRVIDHARNHGLPATRNTGWRSARAPFVFFIDADDLIEPTTLEKCALCLACNPEFAFVKGLTVGFGSQEYLWSKGFHDGPAMLENNLVTATAMVRREVLQRVGGFDESIRRGMEDWEFWLRAAALGHWGDTLPEHLDWYRRRDNQHAAWDNISQETARDHFLRRIRAGHRHIFKGRFPAPSRAWHMPYTYPAETQSDADASAPGHEPEPFRHVANPLAKPVPRLLMIVPWLRMGGADRFNLDLIRFLTRRAEPRWEVTVATTLPGHPWLPEFTALTPDVFCLDHLARVPHIPRLIDHLIGSRRPDVVMVSNSNLGYTLLPYLRSRHPDATFVDFNHMEEPHWQNGGHPRTGAGYQAQLDLSIVVSAHLKRWMAAPPRAADPARIEVCHINADTTTFRPDPEARAAWRRELKLGDEPVVLYAARLCPQKQPMVFARTMQLLAERTERFTAVVAGDGEMLGALESFVAAHRLRGRVRVLGTIPAADMPGLMAASDIFFLPSQWEGIALSIYEAMAAGLCVVGADVGGQAELVSADTGVLLSFPVRDPEAEAAAYADTLERLLAHPQRIHAMGHAARRRIQQHFELDSMGARMLALFDRAHTLKRERPRQTIDPALARELALQAVEMARIQSVAEELWPFRQKWLDLTGEAAQRSQAESQRDAEARAVLEHIENSRPWRIIQAVKATPPYKLLARARFGPDWHLVDPKEPAHIRLQRLRASRAYKLAATAAKLDPARLYASLKRRS